MYISSEFQERLDEVFHGRFRVRWSDKMHEFQLEQKVATGQLMSPPPQDPEAETERWDTYDDNFIRARDGYFYVMSIRNGDRMPCPICAGLDGQHTELKVPVFETRETVCYRCQLMGRDGRFAAVHFDLDDRFIEHIRNLDPETDGPQRARQRIRANRARHQNRLQAELDAADYAVQFNKNQVDNNPMVGYGPKTRQVEVERFREAGR